MYVVYKFSPSPPKKQKQSKRDEFTNGVTTAKIDSKIKLKRKG